MLLLSVTAIACNSFPSDNEVNNVLSGWKTEDISNSEYEELKLLLNRLRAPTSVEDDKICDNAIRRMAQIYKKHPNTKMLEIVDAAEFNNGFRNTMCSFYRFVSNEPSFVNRYKKPINIGALMKCRGISFSPNEIETISSGKTITINP